MAVDNYRGLLTGHQLGILDQALGPDSPNIFVTGRPGVGKTFCIAAICKAMLERYPEPGAVAITSATGHSCIRLHPDAVPIQRWSGFKIFGWDPKITRLVGKIGGRATTDFQRVKVLIIDELHMISGQVFDNLDATARMLRGNQRPFGGIQIIAAGDFHQLPPVQPQRPPNLASESDAWADTFKENRRMLVAQHRHSQRAFVRLLEELRDHRPLSPESKALLRSRSCSDMLPAVDGAPIWLCSSRAAVNEINTDMQKRFPISAYRFRATEWAMPGHAFKDDFSVERELILGLGSKVMLAFPMTVGAVSIRTGTMGHVTRFVDPAKPFRSRNGLKSKAKKIPIVRFEMTPGVFSEYPVNAVEFEVLDGDTEPVSRLVQVPLIHAWAITVHKAAGMSFSRVTVDLKNMFARGQVYTAISRAERLEGLKLVNLDAYLV